MEKLVPTAGHDHNSFDAVGIIKRTTDTWDKFYIYKIRNQNLNGWSDYVKTHTQGCMVSKHLQCVSFTLL